uniref:Transposase IS204/IS1001/IS1096/IS1165 DDE domain-containing protein n=1 Tax=Anaerolinea thermolimosa TaxID=229919 RepID=A0A7C4PME9_9CHLR
MNPLQRRLPLAQRRDVGAAQVSRGFVADYQQVLRRLFGYSPDLKRAYVLQQQLTAIFDRPLTQIKAKHRLAAWIQQVRQSGLTCFDAFLKTLATWWEAITAFFVARANSGFIEGLNNKLKVLKRRCYGLFILSTGFNASSSTWKATAGSASLDHQIWP